jgi:hypothetical protein
MEEVKRRLVTIFSFLLLLLLSGISGKSVFAVTYDLIAPSGTLTRGQEVQFTINVDTEGQTLTNAVIGMSYKSDVLQYISTAAGDAFPTISTDTSTAGQLIFTASNTGGFSGSGTLAIVTYKLIASAPGSTELCVLFNPQDTPPPASPPTTPASTSLPPTGSVEQMATGAMVGTAFLLAAGSALFFLNKRQLEKK